MYGYPYQNYPPKVPGTGASIASMVCGILSVVLCWCYGIVSLILGIVAIVLASKAKKDAGGIFNGMAKAGFICGIIGTILGALFVIYLIVCFMIVGNTIFYELGRESYYYYYWVQSYSSECVSVSFVVCK